MLKLAMGVIAAAAVFGCQRASDSPTGATAKNAAVETQEARAVAMKLAAEAEERTASEECLATLESRIFEYKRKVGAQDPWGAAGMLRRCANLLADPKLKQLVADGEKRAFVLQIRNSKASDNERLRAYEMLARDYPEAARPHARWYAKFTVEAKSRAEEERFANRFNRQVQIGATQQQVAQEGWGYPSQVNRTTTASGIREQWVYGEGRYLYFENNRLTAIQD